MTTKNLAQVWAEMLAALSASMEGRSWKIWMDAAHPRTLEGNTLSLDVSNQFTKDTLQGKYLPMMEESLSQICGQPMEIHHVFSGISLILLIMKSQNYLPGFVANLSCSTVK